MTSSFAELTPVSLSITSSSSAASSMASADFSVKNQLTTGKVNDFHLLVQQLDFDDDFEYSDEKSDDVEVLEDEEDVDEDIYVRYPYERKDKYENLKKSIEDKLLEREEETREIDEMAEEARQMFKSITEKRKMEQSQLESSQIPSIDSIFVCVICSKAFSTTQELQLHTKKSHDLSGNKNPCKLCGKSYKLRKNLLSHMAIHRKEFACTRCNLVFQTAAGLDTHLVKFHAEKIEKDEIEEEQCKNCKKIVPLSTLKQHEWYCLNKEKVLERKKNKWEMEKLSKKSLSVPPSPAMSVASISSFASFQPGPSGFSPVVSPSVSLRDKSCRVCGESFASRQSMLRHVGRKHPEAKDDPNVTAVRYLAVESPTLQYACQDCGKRLTTRAALTTHRARVHLNESRHQCHLCQKTYPLPSELRKHIQRVHQKQKKNTENDVKLADLPDIDPIF